MYMNDQVHCRTGGKRGKEGRRKAYRGGARTRGGACREQVTEGLK